MQFDEVEIPEDMKAKAQEYREKLLDQIVEQDDEVLAAYFEVRARYFIIRCIPAALYSSRLRNIHNEYLMDLSVFLRKGLLGMHSITTSPD